MKTNLTIDAGHPAVRIEVLDANYRIQASGYGKIEENLPTGYYTIQYKAADAMQERDITLLPHKPLHIDEPPDLPFSSAAPLDYTSTSHEYHQDQAHRLSRATPNVYGHGSSVFVFVRDVDPGGQAHPSKGLSLHRLTGETLLIFDEVIESSRGRKEARWCGGNIDVDPGIYRLRLALPNGNAIEMTLPACPYWQSQVFILRQGGDSNIVGKVVLDLPNATQLMARSGDGFEPHGYYSTQKRVDSIFLGEDLRLAELARQALAHGYRGIRSSDLRDILYGKWQDPLLGIFGVHLILQQKKPDLELAKMVVDRLRSILNYFRHPDVDALALEIARRRGERLDIMPLEAPPMLRHSWNILVQETGERPELIPYGSLPFQIADQLWGTGAWLIWEVPKPEMKAQDSHSRPTYMKNTVETRAEEEGVEKLEGAPRSEEPSETQEQNDTETVLNLEDFKSMRVYIEEFIAQQETRSTGINMDEQSQNARLTNVEYALLALFNSQYLVRQKVYLTKSNEPLSLKAVVHQIGIPAELVLASMRSLSVKLEMI